MNTTEQVVVANVDPVTVAEVDAAMAPVALPEHYVVASPRTVETARQALQQSMDRRW